MGREAKVQAQQGELIEMGRLQWEAPELIFRGSERRIWRGEQLAGVAAEGDELVLADGARFLFDDAVQAGRWAQAIANPPTLLDKLGVKAGQRVAVVWVEDADFLEKLAERVEVTEDDDLDLLFLAADSLDDLDQLPEAMARLKPKGAIWIVSRRGKGAAIKDVDVMGAARPLGLVDTKVCAFSATHTALRFTRRKSP